MAKNKKSLKAALNSHQIKMFKQKQSKATEAHKTASVKKDLAKTKSRVAGRPVIPYGAQDTVLLLGEGDFSFARSLITEASTSNSRIRKPQLNPRDITATAFDSENMCYDKYPWAREIVQELRQAGMEILFGIDATKLGNYKHLKGKTYDRVVFNFPHTGKGITDQDRNILSNQQLLVGFFKVAPAMLKQGPSNEARIVARKTRKKPKARIEEDASMSESEPEMKLNQDISSDEDDEGKDLGTSINLRGTVLVSLRDTVPYTLWDMPRLAKKPQDDGARYKQLRSFAFRLEDYPGYSHRRTAGHRGERELPVLKEKDGVTDARTWEFELT